MGRGGAWYLQHGRPLPPDSPGVQRQFNRGVPCCPAVPLFRRVTTVDPLYVLCLLFQIKVGNEVWEGVGWWNVPQQFDAWDGFVKGVTEAVNATSRHFIGPQDKFRFRVQAERQKIPNKVADRMRKKIAEMEAGERPRITWTAVTSEHFELGGEG